MVKFELGNGNALEVEKANRGLEDDYLVYFLEDGIRLDSEYYNKESIEWEYGVKIA